MATLEPNDDRTRAFTALTKGTQVSHYEIVDKIGAGGMGEVYLARDPDLDRPVALKFLSPHICHDEDCRSRFLREAQAAAKLSHPGIVTVYEVGEFRDRPFLAMEFIEGRSLRDAIDEGALTPDDVARIAEQLCECLASAHASGVVHRDIKPSNILLDTEGRPRLLDFGLAAVRGTDSLTRAGTMFGTPGYMSPEQVEGKQADARSDLFSLGVVLYEAIAGNNPFRRDNEAATLHAIVRDTPVPLTQYKARVPAELQVIVSGLLEKDPGLRYQTAADVASALKRLRSHGTTEAPPVAASRRPVAIWMIALLVIATAAVIWLMPSKDKPVSRMDVTLVAVLPFENIGDEEDDYIVDGITDEILVNLSNLSGLGVISRSSTREYRGSNLSLARVGKELGVDHVLQGTVRWDQSGGVRRLRISPRLVQISTGVNLWADRITVVLDDVFGVQASVAQKVAEAMGVALLDRERVALDKRPTDNAEAYDYYLRGNQYYSSDETDLTNAVQMFEKAISIDPTFALAYAKLGMVHTQLYWHRHDRSEERLAKAREAIHHALALDSAAAEVQFALGWYYYHGDQDYDQALEQFALVAQTQPGNTDVMRARALVFRRQGRWESAVSGFEEAVRVCPRSADLADAFAGTLVSLRQYARADSLFERALAIEPDHPSVHGQRWLMYLLWDGDTKRARGALAARKRMLGDGYDQVYQEVILEIADGRYQAARERLDGSLRSFAAGRIDTVIYWLQMGDVSRHQGGLEHQVYYDSAYTALDAILEDKGSDPDVYLYLHMSKACAHSGHKNEAIRNAMLAIDRCPMSKDAVIGPDMISNLAEVYCAVGDYGLCVDRLEYLLSIPSWVSRPYLAFWPEFDPVREHPDFKALLLAPDSASTAN